MTGFRHHLRRHRALAVWLVALALLMRVAIPTGYMVAGSGESLTIELCSGYGPQAMAAAMPGMAHHPARTDEHGKPELPCAFSGLAAPSLAGADPLLLAGAILLVLATLFRVAVRPVAVRSAPHLRPPLRGPPGTALT